MTSEKEADLSPKQLAVIVNLLGGMGVEQAAKTAGVGESTVWGWLRDQGAFKREYRSRQRQAMESATCELQSAASEAVKTLKSVMNDPVAPHSAKVSAAKATLDTAFRAFDAVELADRIDELEAASSQSGKPPRSSP